MVDFELDGDDSEGVWTLVGRLAWGAQRPASAVLPLSQLPASMQRRSHGSAMLTPTYHPFPSPQPPPPPQVREGLYALALKRFLTVFPKEQLLVINRDDIKQNPVSVRAQSRLHISASTVACSVVLTRWSLALARC